jgi:uncharacterized membrane protein
MIFLIDVKIFWRIVMKKKLFLAGIISVILIFGFIVVGCEGIQYTNTFIGTWTGSGGRIIVVDDGTENFVAITKIVFTDSTFTVTATHKDTQEEVTKYGYPFSGTYEVTGSDKADLYDIVGTSGTSGTADIRYNLQYGESLILDIDGVGTYIFPKEDHVL